MKTVKYAFIGFGNNGMSHFKQLRNNQAVKFVAAADISQERLDRAESEMPGIHCYSDYLEMLDKEQIDAVCVSTPHRFHYEQVMAALDGGCHVYLEKPMGLSERECQEAVDTAKKKKLILQVGFECRKSALYTRIKEIIDSGEIGELNAMTFYHYRGAWMKEWYCRKEQAGENIAVIETCHYIDLMRFWSGEEVEWVFATASRRNLRKDYNYPDTEFCQMGFKNGMIASLIDSHAVSSDRFMSAVDNNKSYATGAGEYMDPVYGHRFEYTIIGSKGSLIINMFARTISVITMDYEGKGGRPQMGLKRIEDYRKLSFSDLIHNYAELDNSFIDCVLNNQPPAISPEDALQTHRVVFAIEASEKQNKKIEL